MKYALLLFACALLSLAAAIAVAVFSEHHEGYWLALELPIVVACVVAALGAACFAFEDMVY